MKKTEKGVYQHLGATPKCLLTHKHFSTPGKESIGVWVSNCQAAFRSSNKNGIQESTNNEGFQSPRVTSWMGCHDCQDEGLWHGLIDGNRRYPSKKGVVWSSYFELKQSTSVKKTYPLIGRKQNASLNWSKNCNTQFMLRSKKQENWGRKSVN